jgi:hypothetical protein
MDGKMIVAIHQPNYLPYLGFFDKMKQSDVFVIYDDAQFNKEDFHHRNKIRIYHGWKWLTVPVKKKLIPINRIFIRNEVTIKGLSWSDAHLNEIKDNYKVTPHYSTYEQDIFKIYQRSYEKLIDLNMEIIYFLMDAFNIKKKIIFSSELGFTSKSSQRLIEIVEALGSNIYLSGPGGQEYLDISLFNDKGIKVLFQDYKNPLYDQYYKGFIPNLSAIDALFNIGNLSE